MKCTKCNKQTNYGCFMNNCPVAKLKFSDKGKPIEVTKADEESVDILLQMLDNQIRRSKNLY